MGTNGNRMNNSGNLEHRNNVIVSSPGGGALWSKHWVNTVENGEHSGYTITGSTLSSGVCVSGLRSFQPKLSNTHTLTLSWWLFLHFTATYSKPWIVLHKSALLNHASSLTPISSRLFPSPPLPVFALSHILFHLLSLSPLIPVCTKDSWDERETEVWCSANPNLRQ